jgi:hypothetical protein
MDGIKKWFLIFSLITFGSLIYAYFGPMAIDRCLDHGGRWNYQQNTCEHAQ